MPSEGVAVSRAASAVEGRRTVDTRSALRTGCTPAGQTFVCQRLVLLRYLREFTAGVPTAAPLTAVFAQCAAAAKTPSVSP